MIAVYNDHYTSHSSNFRHLARGYCCLSSVFWSMIVWVLSRSVCWAFLVWAFESCCGWPVSKDSLSSRLLCCCGLSFGALTADGPRKIGFCALGSWRSLTALLTLLGLAHLAIVIWFVCRQWPWTCLVLLKIVGGLLKLVSRFWWEWEKVPRVRKIWTQITSR